VDYVLAPPTDSIRDGDNSMSIYEVIRREAQQMEVELTDTQINRIVGTLRFAGGDYNKDLLREEINRFLHEVQKPPVETANRQQPMQTSFRQIDASIESGTCPRCGRKMRSVKLADYTPATYCDGECRIVLWPPEKK
jgi:hypothetical protein